MTMGLKRRPNPNTNPVNIMDKDALVKMAIVEARGDENYIGQKYIKLLNAGDPQCDPQPYMHSFTNTLRWFIGYQEIKNNSSIDDTNDANEPLSYDTDIDVIYGVSGIFRWFVRRNGDILFSHSHSVYDWKDKSEHTERAKQLGFRIG